MTKEDINKFLREDIDFLTQQYPNLSRDNKLHLWVDYFGHDLMYHGRFVFIDPLEKFTESNYAKWKQIEPDFDSFLTEFIVEFVPAFNVPYEGKGERTLEQEIYRRLGKTE
jgi:hypothetical protein